MTTKLFLHWFLLFILTFALLSENLTSAKAQSFKTGDDIVSFLTLGQQDAVLSGPLDSQEIVFRLPADWSMLSDSILHINLNAATGMASSENSGVVGFFEVYLNENWLTTVNLATDGEYSVDIPIPANAWVVTKSDASQKLRFALVDALRCELWLSAATTGGSVRGLSAVVRSSSYIDFKHDTRPVATDLKLFPYPVFQNTFKPDQAVLVVPDQPTQGEMQAAMTVSAALGRLTDKKFALQLLTVSQLTDALIAESHLVFIGAPTSFPQITGAKLPAPYNGTTFDGVQMDAGDGILQLIVSPQNPSKVWLLISGNNDAAIMKAAQAVGSDQIQPYGPNNLAIITGVGVEAQYVDKTDFTFSDLGYPVEQTYYGTYNDFGVWFDLPANQVSDGAYFEMVFANSAVLNYDESNVKVIINDNLVGGLRFSDRTSSITHWKFNIPASFLHPGRNLLLLELYLSAPSPCIPFDEVWFSLMPESLLHLPTSAAVGNGTPALELANYPYSALSTFDQTALILPSGDPFAWSAASKLAVDLGRKLGGANINIDTYYADAVPEDVLRGRDLVLVGRPSTMPVIAQLSEMMPAPFEKGSDIAQQQDSQYSFSSTDRVPVGYIQVFSSPWDSKLAVLTVSGNMDEGLGSAATALLTSSVQKQMIGNYVVVLNDKIIVQRISAASTSPTSQQVILPSTEESGDTGQTGKTGKINISLPLIVLIVVLILVAIGVYVFFVMDKGDNRGKEINNSGQ